MKTLKNKLPIIISAALLIISVACVIGISRISSSLPEQRRYINWRGDSETEFSQVSCFISSSDKITSTEINTFRTAMVKAFSEASLDTENLLFNDCWSLDGTCKISTDKTSTDASAIIVGGDFFDFHPLDLLSGGYFSDSDSLKDKVIIDEELAWYLFGSNDVVDMSVNIGGNIYYIAGVIDHEDNFASKKAYKAGMCVFLPYSTYTRQLEEVPGITCYEVALPNPVKNFALNLVQSKFPSKQCDIIENAGRFSFSNLVKIAFHMPLRAMNSSVPYPYWENAARYAENIAAILLIFSFVTILFPLFTFVKYMVKWIKIGKEKVSGKYWPDLKEKTEEKIRVRQRARWEKQHPGQK